MMGCRVQGLSVVQSAIPERQGRDWICASGQSVHYWPMQASLTDLQRKTGKVTAPVRPSGQTVEGTGGGLHPAQDVT